MYVDDIVTGANSLEEATELKQQLCDLFAKGGFSLDKWASTEAELVPDATKNQKPFTIKQPNVTSEGSLKILDLMWDPSTDSFSYNIRPPPQFNITKRIVLSSIARVFDPLGFLAPIIFSAKLLMQELWKSRLDWDDILPEHLQQLWCNLTNDWDILSALSIPRHVTSPSSKLRLIGFCDASTKGYAAAVYLRTRSDNGEIRVSLIKAKTKVAPVKFMTIARLELCGALLLSRLLSSITLEGCDPLETLCFSDSSVVLAWLQTPTHLLKVFEANRVSEILGNTLANNWRHVKSEENPCDIASRVCTPRRLQESHLWWRGPHWLFLSMEEWPMPTLVKATVPVTRSYPAFAEATDNADHWMCRFSSLTRLMNMVIRIVRYWRRATNKSLSFSDPITYEECHDAKMRCVKLVQRSHFPRIDIVSKQYAQLSPFLDDNGIIRVGGRLQNSPLCYSSRHPILLPRSSHFSNLVVDDLHKRHFHAGPSLTLSLLRGQFWIPQAPRLIRKRIVSCIQCRISGAKPVNPQMAPLPKDRFAQFRAFSNVGIDFAGPFTIKESNRRKASLGKAYLCLFVCLSSKALHLEVVSSLSTLAFLATLDRFTSRRGLPQVIWTDNGTNFVGASRFIKDIYKFHAENEDSITRELAHRGIEWKFIPPRAPHFGGIWEAGVKSAKTLLSNSLGRQPYTFEELTTAFCKIEALLNSRPLCALSEDPENFSFLTPGHFLIGAPISCLPEPDDSSERVFSRPRWRTVQQQITSIWNRWRTEYLHTLAQRKKWTKTTPNLQPGDLVILVEKRSILGHWPVARVLHVHPDSEGVVRTVTLRCPSGSTLHRAVSSLAPLFPEGSKDSQL